MSRELHKSRVRQQILSILSDDIDLKSLASDIKMRQYIQYLICTLALFGLLLGIYVNEHCSRGYQPTPVWLYGSFGSHRDTIVVRIHNMHRKDCKFPIAIGMGSAQESHSTVAILIFAGGD